MKRETICFEDQPRMTTSVAGCGAAASSNGVATNQTADTADTREAVIALKPN